MTRLLIFLLLAGITCSYALLRGGRPERWGATSCLIAFVATFLVHQTIVDLYSRTAIMLFMIDLGLLVAFLTLAARAARYWPIWCAALQLVSVTAHIVRWVDEEMFHLGYAVLLAAPIYPILLLLSLGTWRHQQRLKHGQIDPDWRQSFR